LEIVLLSLLGTFGLTLSIYALMRTLVPKPRSLADIDSKTEQRNRKIIAELLPPGVDTLDELADRMVSCAVGASELSVMAADAIDGDESRMLDRLALVQTRNYRIFAERRERILDRLEQAQLRRDIFSSSLLFLAGALIASGAMIPAGVKSRIEPSTAKIYILHPTTLERQERWSHLGVLSCVVGNEGELPVISTGDAAPSPGSIVDTIGFPEECQKRSLVVPSWVTITELIVERIE